MKKILFFLILFGLQKALHAQQPYIYTIKADSVKITNTCDTAELIIENHTQNVPGFLFNKGKGRTEFRRASKLNDSIIVIGGDTLVLRGNTTASNGLSMGGKDVQLGGLLIKDSTIIDANGKKFLIKAGNGGRQFSIHSDNYGFATESPVNYFSQLNFYCKDTSRRQAVIGNYNGTNYDSRNLFVSVGDDYPYSDYPATGLGMRFEIRTGYGGGNTTRFFRNGNVGIGTSNYRLTTKLAVGGTGLFTDTLKLPNIIGKTDTSVYKPMVADANGNVFKMNYWPGGGGSGQNFANTDLTFTGNRIHDGVYRYLNLNNFGGISMKTKSYQGWPEAELLLDTLEGFKLTMEDKTVPLPIKSALNIYPDMLKFNLVEDNQNLYSDFQMFHDILSFKGTNGANYSNLKIQGSDFNLSTNYAESTSAGIGCYHHHDGYLLLNTGVKNGVMTLTSSNSGSGENFVMQFDHADSVVLGHNDNQYSNTRFVQFKDKFIFKNAHTGILNFNLIGLPVSASTADNLLVVDNNGQVKQIAPQSLNRKSATVTGSSYTVPADVEVVFVNYTAGQATITLPTGTLDREITIKNLHTTNTVIISGLDTSESNSIGTRGAITVKYTGSAWVGISKY